MAEQGKFTIRGAADKFGYSEMYMRRMILDGKLPGAEKVNGVWQVDESALIAKRAKTTNDRESRTFIVHVKSEDTDKVRALLVDKYGINLEPRFVYDDKRKAYNAKRNAAKKAAKAV